MKSLTLKDSENSVQERELRSTCEVSQEDDKEKKKKLARGPRIRTQMSKKEGRKAKARHHLENSTNRRKVKGGNSL